MSKPKVLVVDDEESILDFITMALEHEGYQVVTATSGTQALEVFQNERPQCVILDWMLPDLDGLQVCQRLRQASSVPILMLTAKGEWEDRVKGLDAGADDYLAKPFKYQELLARMRAVLRRVGSDVGSLLTFGDLNLNVANRSLLRQDKPIELTHREFELLEYLMRNPRQLVTREQLLTNIWGWDYDGNANVVEVHLSSLRAKLQDNDRKLIRTVRGAGYILGG
ncbi:response regulator transcription factor [bacterium]|nr:response regulator transcription factor [bacterium]